MLHSWADRGRNEELLQRVKEERNIIHTAKRRKANWIGHILCRNCLINHVIEGKLEGKIYIRGRQGTRHKQKLDDVKVKREYCKFKDKALDHTVSELGLE
jgi:hypothetical protein